MILMFLGILPFAYPVECEKVEAGFTLVRQLAEETLVAVVEMLRALELLYLVNADVDVPALLDVLIELRQFDDTTELALDPIGRPLRVLFGETARTEGLERWSWKVHCSGGTGGLVDSAYPGDRLGVFIGRVGETEVEGGSRARRPRLQVEEASVSAFEGAARGVEWLGGDGAFKPIRTLVTLVAMA